MNPINAAATIAAQPTEEAMSRLSEAEVAAIGERAKLCLENIGPTAICPLDCLFETGIPRLLADREAILAELEAAHKENERLRDRETDLLVLNRRLQSEDAVKEKEIAACRAELAEHRERNMRPRP